MKGGDAYGKVPKRIAIAKRQGEKRTMPGPGKKLLRGAEIPRFTRNKLRNLEQGSLK